MTNMLAGSELRLWGSDRASLGVSDEGGRDEEMATGLAAVCVEARSRTRPASLSHAGEKSDMW